MALCAPAEMGELRAIEKAMKLTIPVIGGAPWTGAAAEKPAPKGSRGGGAPKPNSLNKPARSRRRRPKNKGQARRAA